LPECGSGPILSVGQYWKRNVPFRRRIVAGSQFGNQGLDFVLVVQKKFDIVTACKAQITVAVFFRHVADLADVVCGQKPGRSGAYGVESLSRFAYVHEDARFQDFMVKPFSP